MVDVHEPAVVSNGRGVVDILARVDEAYDDGDAARCLGHLTHLAHVFLEELGL